MVLVNKAKAEELAPLFSKAILAAPVDDFTNPELYPPRSAPAEVVSQYFLVMVAMDHRLSRKGAPYEGFVGGKLYHGADLLYRLGAKMLEENPEFFSAESLAKVTAADVLKWLSAERPEGVAAPPDPDLRAALLRDLGKKLLALYGGSALELVKASGGLLRGPAGEGLVSLLKVFVAYQDPVEKKCFLLAKFLERRELLRVLDPDSKEVPVDNHLTRLAIRLGLVELDEGTLSAIKAGRGFTEQEDVILRSAVRYAYKILSKAARCDPFLLDDFLWSFGRATCTRELPACRSGSAECPFKEACAAYANEALIVPEHSFTSTWWY